ncbi:MAG TPA: DNA topoisomerase I [Candidatus Nanoarchaeia archaeon]|nr:DNA topoisomerase I [Candidatus Nanoarchaeia archaeon]
MKQLIITEKPKSAQQIANALADKKPSKKIQAGVAYYELTHEGKQIVVASTIGHIFGLAEKNKKGWKYPVFEVEWKPLNEVQKSNTGAKKYVSALKTLVKGIDSIVIATDYDIEGEVIGLNVVRYIAKKTDAQRMKYSTLTKPDLIEAYKNISPTLDWAQANAGETRHILDWYWGINLSRALTIAVKTTGGFKLLSSGRVQGPALKIIVDKEKEIRAFKSEPYWEVQLVLNENNVEFIAQHENGRFTVRNEAEKAHKNAEAKTAKVTEVNKSEFKQQSPHPFDLTSMQIEAYKTVRISPKETLEIAQDLYTSGYISYPRTSSQQLPPAIGFKKILSDLSKQGIYSALTKKLLSGELKPNNGKKTDAAHPAIFPTGIEPKKLDGKKAKIYDLIARRFLATFAESATRENVTAKFRANTEPFVASGIRTIQKGWHEYYGPFLKLKEFELPKLKEGQDVKITSVDLLDKETQPPRRYTEASIIKELERENLGTKATRAQIVDTLFERGYVQGHGAIEATDLGIQTVETLEQYVPRILDQELTRHFEIEMEEIREGTKKPKEVLSEAKEVLIGLLAEFKEKEVEIGKQLHDANRESEDKANTIGECLECKQGTLMMRRSKFGRFIACSRYPDCSTTFKLPATGFIKPAGTLCQTCNFPNVLVIKKRRQPQEICINLKCPTKKIPDEIESKPCPTCKEGMLVLRKSIYGGFLGCNRFPKCRYIAKIQTV